MNYTIRRNGEQYGPYTREDVTRYLNQGSLLLTDLAWISEEQRWAPLHELHLAAPPAGRTPAWRSNKIALFSTFAVWIAWFFLPFVTVGIGPFRMAGETLPGCLDLTFNSGLALVGLLAIAAPAVALLVNSRLAKCLYLAPLVFLGATALIVSTQLNQILETLSAEWPFLADIVKEVGTFVAVNAISFGTGAYLLLFSSLLLGSQVFARR